MKPSLLTLTLLLVAGAGFSADGAAQALAPLDAEAAVQFQREMTRNVGRALPAGLVVQDRDGRDMDLRDALGTRTILFKFGPQCEPCAEILAYLKDNPPGEADPTVEVLMVGQNESDVLEPLPGIRLLHSASEMEEEGFLAGKYTPTTFYFDADSVLVKREVGAPFSLAQLLRFPSGS